jgi:hypothetical protein
VPEGSRARKLETCWLWGGMLVTLCKQEM